MTGIESVMFILEPTNVGDHTDDLITFGELPERVKAFGYFVDLSMLSPGDILLFDGVEPTKGGRAVKVIQSKSFEETHARWSHAAIYISKGVIVEALPRGGVVERSISEYVPGYTIRALRIPDLSEAERFEIAFAALRKTKQYYSLVGAGFEFVRVTLNLQNSKYRIGRMVFCSQICYASIIEGAGVFPEGCPIADVVYPAALSGSSTFESVKLRWARINGVSEY
ncbi:MAG: hypothetical protein ACE37J_20730 [Pikeienuella sp.]|uniref:hypothetical protein n=1 Tax=Pikeienuella sp. TaxID=2831957 RepID=UPI003919D4BE